MMENTDAANPMILQRLARRSHHSGISFSWSVRGAFREALNFLPACQTIPSAIIDNQPKRIVQSHSKSRKLAAIVAPPAMLAWSAGEGGQNWALGVGNL